MGDADFGGYATKAGLKCTDGRTITPEAFKHMDGLTVPLVWQHMKDDPKNVLGHGVLEARADGMYVHGYFNDTENGKHARALLEHKDIKSLSIYANQLVEKAKTVLHGMIIETSLVLSGANPGAKIDFVRIAHSDGDFTEMDDEAVIFTGLPIEAEIAHAEGDADADDEDDDEGPTVREVYEAFTPEQKDVVDYLVGEALNANAEAPAESAEQSSDSDDTDEDSLNHNEDTTEDNLTHQEGTEHMTTNVFEKNGEDTQDRRPTLSHSQLMTIVEDAKQMGSWKDAMLKHAGTFGINDIELLFPDARNVTNTPDFIKRRTEWVNRVISGTKHSPFSRIKSMFADITADEARAKGYLKGNLKKEEFFGLSKRTTTPATVYKKQKLDRDDILDITDFDVVQWLWARCASCWTRRSRAPFCSAMAVRSTTPTRSSTRLVLLRARAFVPSRTTTRSTPRA